LAGICFEEVVWLLARDLRRGLLLKEVVVVSKNTAGTVSVGRGGCAGAGDPTGACQNQFRGIIEEEELYPPSRDG